MKIRIKQFREAYWEANRQAKVKFKIRDKEFVCVFAKYLLEHLDNIGKKENEFISFDKPNIVIKKKYKNQDYEQDVDWLKGFDVPELEARNFINNLLDCEDDRR